VAKNRKNKSVGIRFGPAIKALLICSLFVVSGVGYVWQKSLIADLDGQIKAQELALAECQVKNTKLRGQLAGLRSPDELKLRLAKLNVGLAPPQEVWRLEEPAEPSPVRPPSAVQQFAARP